MGTLDRFIQLFLKTEIRRVLLIMAIVIVIDIVTGLINAFLQKELNSTKMREGLVKKFYEFVIVLIGYLLDVLLSTGTTVCIAVALFYVIEEMLSIIENTSKYVPYPEIITKTLDKLKEHKEE